MRQQERDTLERDTEKEITASAATAAAPETDTQPRPAPARRKPSKPLPDDWRPSQAHSAFAREHGLDLSTEVLKFRAHAEANDRRQVSWDAAFTQWLATSLRYGNRQGPAPVAAKVVGPSDEQVAQILRDPPQAETWEEGQARIEREIAAEREAVLARRDMRARAQAAFEAEQAARAAQA